MYSELQANIYIYIYIYSMILINDYHKSNRGHKI